MRCLAAVLLVCLSLPGIADDAAAVQALHASLVKAMQIDTHAEREALLRPVIQDTFDIERIAGISLGRTWRELESERRQAFQEILMDLVVATYANRFREYNNQRFVTDTVEEVRKNVVVRTRLLRPGDKDVQLDYVLNKGKIFNVIADGVSDLSLRRADYNSIVKQEGYASLLQHLRDKTNAARNE